MLTPDQKVVSDYLQQANEDFTLLEKLLTLCEMSNDKFTRKDIGLDENYFEEAQLCLIAFGEKCPLYKEHLEQLQERMDKIEQRFSKILKEE